MLHYELGHLSEFGFGQAGQAVQHYLAAYNLDRDFRLALYALLRLFEQRGSHPNLPRLYAAQERATRTPTELAAARVDVAVAACLERRDLEQTREALDQALAADPSSLEAALLREGLVHESPSESPGAMAALVCRAHHTDDPQRQALALTELGEALSDAGESDEGRSAALKAVRLAPALESTHLAAQALTRREGAPDQLVDALTRHARQLGSWLEAEGDALPARERAALTAEAAALWCEAARLGIGPLTTPGDALANLAEAARLTPNDPWIGQLRMFAHDLLEDRKAAAAEAEALLAAGVEGKHAAGLHFRCAELALTDGELERAREQLTRAMECSGGSRAAAAMLDDLLFDEGRHAPRLARLRADAEADPAAALEGALVAAHDLADAGSARELFAQAASHAPLEEAARREAYWAALALEDPASVRAALEGLLASELPDPERAAVIHHWLETPELSLSAHAERLSHEMANESCSPWLATLVRLRAAERGDWGALALAHLALAAHDRNPEEQSAHLCAAARAQLRAGQPEAAETSLRRALELAPAQPYPLALLQEALRQSGHQSEVVELLVQTAEQQKSSADAELSLLLAGAEAEATGDQARAIEAYREAADRSPGSAGPLWALWRVAERSGDPELRLRTRRALAEREQREGGAAHETLLLAGELEALGKGALAQDELQRLWEAGPALAAYAGVDLTLLKDGTIEARRQALDALAGAEEQGRGPWLRAREGWRASETLEARREAIGQVLEHDPADRWALWTAVALAGGAAEAESTPTAAAALARVVEDRQLAEGLRAEALRARGGGSGGGGADDGDDETPTLSDRLRAMGVAPEGPLGTSLTRALLETVPEGEDPDQRVRAHAERLAGVVGEERAATLRGLARAHMQAGDADAATDLLIGRLTDAPEDLACWELLRVAARAAGRPEWVAAACDSLAERLTGTLWAELSEEAAAVRMDQLAEDAEAEEILRAVLSRYPQRPIAYQRLHDLLSERDDTAALLELVNERIEAIDRAEELVHLFYEQARLCRAEGDLEGALAALENLLLLDDEHVAGLALSAEVHTAGQDWEGAVDALRALAQTDIPGAQRKLARLGAADYLEKKLGRPDDALDELLAIETEGLAGPAVYVRMADLYEDRGDLAKCARALQAAVGEQARERRAALHLRLAKLHLRLEQPGAATADFGEVLALEPTHLEAAREKAALLDHESERQALLLAFEDAVRDVLFAKPDSPLPYRKLCVSAELRGDLDLARRALESLRALGALDPEEDAWLEAHPAKMSIDPGAALTDAELALLLTPASDPAYRQLALPALRAAADAEGLEPGKFGVGRSQRVAPREPHPLRDEIQAMLVALGGELADFYVGGSVPTLVAAAPKGFATHMVVGASVTSPMTAAQRHEAALQAAASRLGCLPLLWRSPAEAARLLHAALRAAERPLADSIDPAGLDDKARALWKAASRRDRKAMEEASRQLDDGGVGARAHVERATQHARRLALLLGGNLEAALTHLLNAPPDANAILGSEAARDLIRAWLSPQLGELRRKLGIGA